MSGSGFGHFRYAANEFYSKIFFTIYSRLLTSLFATNFNFTVQRVNEASFFEETHFQEVARPSMGFIMLRLARVVRQ